MHNSNRATNTGSGWRKTFRRDIKVFVHLFPWRVTLIMIGSLVATAWLFQYMHNLWEAAPISFFKAIFAIINMVFLQLTFADLPKDTRLDIFPVAIPLIGLPLFSIFGLKIINIIRIFFLRAERGQEWQETLVRSTVENHIIICGLGRVGYRVAKDLHLNYDQPLVGIEETVSPLVNELLAMGIPIILGNTESEEVLQKAGIVRAKAAVICTNTDLVNLGTAVLIRKLHPEARIVLRLFDDELMAEIQAKFKLDAVISRSAVAAATFTYAAIGGEIVETFELANREYVLAYVPLGPTSPMLGRTIGQVAEEQDVTVVCHSRGQTLTVDPDPTKYLACDDTIFIFTTVAEMIELIEHGITHRSLLVSPRRGPVLVCGLGHTGYRVASNLADLGCQVVALDFEENILARRLGERGIGLMYGDLRWKKLLLEAGMEQATAIVVCTDDDMVNLQIALRARAIKPNIRVVLRVFDAHLSEQLRRSFGINTAVYSTSALATPDFVAAALDRMNMRFVKIGDRTQAIVRLQIKPSQLSDLPLEALHDEEDVTVLLHARNGQVDIPPRLETRLQVGDEIVVMATEDMLETLNQRNKTEAAAAEFTS